MKIIEPEIFKKFPELKFGISTKSGGDDKPPYYFNLNYRVGDNAERVKRNRKLFFDKLGINESRVSFQRQTHSVKSYKVTVPTFYEDSDALYTNERNNFLAVSIADCIPVFLYEPEKKVVAAIHSGWKGTLNKITTLTVEKIIKEFSIESKNIYTYIGPGISEEYFEVGNDVAELFEENVKIKRNGKNYIDLKKHNFHQLINIGVANENIEVSDYCTYREKNLLHSYRRDKDKSGRMLGVIGMI
ncbi:MAG: peptidoglycan editing factor PgeF [Ignavibacteriae bacterium]|nr:peptidoglycan editing factor PgeF [Ignavibacteriota bacterium]